MRVVTAVLILLLVTACNGNDVPPSAADQDPIVMRIYSVPPARAQEIRDSVSYLINTGTGEGVVVAGRASVIGADRIAVAARASLHSGVEQLIDVAGEAAVGEPPRIRFQYWLVRAEPGRSGDVPSALASIEDVLKQAQEQIGPATFSVLDYAEHVVRSGASSEVAGRILQGHVEAAARSGRIAADLELVGKAGAGHIGTEIDLRDGETVILALVGERNEREASQQPGFNAFVIHAETF